MITVDADKKRPQWLKLLSEVENQRLRVRIYRQGKPVADLVPVTARANPLVQFSDLAGEIVVDPTLPLDEQDWPLEMR